MIQCATTHQACEVPKSSANRRENPRFPTGCLVRVVSDKGIPPEGFRPGGGFDIITEEIPVGSVGVVVNPPSSRYIKPDFDSDIMSWVLVLGQLLEVPHFHLRRCDEVDTKKR